MAKRSLLGIKILVHVDGLDNRSLSRPLAFDTLAIVLVFLRESHDCYPTNAGLIVINCKEDK